MRPSNDSFFVRRPRSNTNTREENERRAAIARAAAAPSDLTPAPPATLKGLKNAWREFCATSGKNEKAERATTAALGRVRIEARGILSSLRLGDIVLVWHDHPAARNPLCTVWHPRNEILTIVSTETVDMVQEATTRKRRRK